MARWIAFLVGVDEYSFLEKLKGAKNDAESLWKVLIDPKTGLFDKDTSRLVINPSKHQLEQALALFFDELKSDDVLLLYFAGHGAALHNKLYLATTETCKMKSDNINPATATPFSVVEDLLRYAPSKSVMTIIDACQSAALGEDIESLRAVLGSAGVNVHRSLGHGYQYLSACRPPQLAQETDVGSAYHGQLTATVIKVIRHGANVPSTEEFVTFTAVSRFVQDQMSNLENQQPVQFNSDLVSPITVARNVNYEPPQNWS